MNRATANTDRELWRERPDDYYADSLFVTADGGIGMNVGGHCIVRPIREWHKLAAFKCKAQRTADPPQDCDWPFCGCDPYADKVLDAIQESGFEIRRIAHSDTMPAGTQEIIFTDPIRGGEVT